jgi:hypothetical protein
VCQDLGGVVDDEHADAIEPSRVFDPPVWLIILPPWLAGPCPSAAGACVTVAGNLISVDDANGAAIR